MRNYHLYCNTSCLYNEYYGQEQILWENPLLKFK